MKKYPKIGIRPTIDGRQGGVRESLEDKTMNLAKAVAELISSNLKNGDGSPVECVIADSTIGRVAESAACAEKFEREGVGATITVTSCWCYGSETMDMHPHWPKAVWGFNGTERPGAVYLAAVLAGHAQKGSFFRAYWLQPWRHGRNAIAFLLHRPESCCHPNLVHRVRKYRMQAALSVRARLIRQPDKRLPDALCR